MAVPPLIFLYVVPFSSLLSVLSALCFSAGGIGLKVGVGFFKCKCSDFF